MKYIHVKNLEEYYINYKDRQLSWCKAHFKMINSDPEFEMLCEVDRWRFIAFIMLELQLQKPVPLDLKWLSRKGFDQKKRPILLTIKMLHTFLEITELPLRNCNGSIRNVEKDIDIEIEKEIDIEIEGCNRKEEEVNEFWCYFLKVTKKTYLLTKDKLLLIKGRLAEGYTVEQLKYAADRFVEDEWEGRQNHMDLIYCIGKQKGKADNLEKWVNKKPKHVKKGIERFEIK